MSYGMVFGAALGMAGTAMTMDAQQKRAAATKRIAAAMKSAGADSAAENYNVSDNLRKALQSIAEGRTSELGDYFERRISPERVTAAERARDERDAAAGGGMERALSALRGPAGSYTPDSAPFQQSLEGFEQRREMPSLEALLDQISAQGYLTGGLDYDTQNQQQLALGVRPLDNEAELRNLLTGVRQAESSFAFNRLMAKLNRDMDAAEKKGAKELFWGTVMQTVGAGAAGAGASGGSQSTTAPAATSSRPSQETPVYTGPAYSGPPVYSDRPLNRPGGEYTIDSPGALDLPGVDPERPAV